MLKRGIYLVLVILFSFSAYGITGDFNNDDYVKFDDFLIFADGFRKFNENGIYDKSFDLDNDDKIGLSDFLIFAEGYGKCKASPFKCSDFYYLESNVIIPQDKTLAIVGGENINLITLAGNHFFDGDLLDELEYTSIVAIGEDIDEQILSAYTSEGYLNIFLPHLKWSGKGIGLCRLYVADDGSTYYGDLTHDCSGKFLKVDESFTEEHLARQSPCGKKCEGYCGIDGECVDSNPPPLIMDPKLMPKKGQPGTKFNIDFKVLSYEKINSIKAIINFGDRKIKEVMLNNKQDLGDSVESFYSGKLDSKLFSEGIYNLDLEVVYGGLSVLNKKNLLQFEIKFKNNKDCKLVRGNGDVNNLDIVFLSDNFDDLEDFNRQIEKSVSLMEKMEPYASNLDRINIYKVNKLNNFQCNGPYIRASEGTLDITCDWESILETANICEVDEIVVLSRRDLRSFSNGYGRGLNYGLDQNTFAVVFIGEDASSYIIDPGKELFVNLDSGKDDYAEILTKGVKSCYELPDEMFIKINNKTGIYKSLELGELPMLREEKERFPVDKYNGYYYCFPTPHSVDPSISVLRVVELKKVNLEENGPMMILHEIGHSFAGLDDEYAMTRSSPPTNFKSVNCLPCSNFRDYKIEITEKRTPTKGCTYDSLCKQAHFGIMWGSYVGDLTYGEDNEKYIQNLLDKNFYID